MSHHSRRLVARPQLPPGPVKDLKDFLHDLYLAAGGPTLEAIVVAIGEDAHGDLPLGSLSTTAISDCLSSTTPAAWGTTSTVGGALLTLAGESSTRQRSAKRSAAPSTRTVPASQLYRNLGQPTPERVPKDQESLTRLRKLWEAASRDASVNDRYGGDPRMWQALIVTQLDELGTAAAESVLEQWRKRAPLDPAWLAWMESLIRLTAQGRLQRRSHRPLPATGSRSFVGRQIQKDQLQRFLERARQGRGGLALVFGPAGMGKSRLLAEVLVPLRDSAQIEWVQFSRGEAGYRGWRRLLGPLWTAVRRTELAPIELRPHANILDNILLAATESGQAGRLPSGTVADAIAALLKHAANRRPVVLAVDDAHRGGASSDQLLLDLAERLGSDPVGLIAALRPDELEGDTPFREYDDQATDQTAPDVVTPVRLPPLGVEATSDLLSHRTGKPTPHEVVERVLRKTGGRPQLILHTPIEISGPADHPSSWITGKLELEGLQVLMSTLQSRSPEMRTILEAAAVCAVDMSIDPSELAFAVDLPIKDIDSSLDQERQQGSILAKRGLEYSFEHESWIDALSELCPLARRSELHAKCLEFLRRNPAVDPRVLARHAIGAGVRLVGVSALVAYTRKAADLAFADYAFGAAVDLYSQAVEHATGETRVKLLIANAEALRFQGRWDEARDRLRAAFRQAQELGSPALEAETEIHLHRMTWSFGLDEDELTQQIRDTLERLSLDEATLRARLQALMAARLSVTERQYPDEQADLARQAQRHLPNVVDPAARADIIDGVRGGLQDIRPPDELLELDREQLALGVKLQSRYHIGEGLFRSIVDVLRAGRLAELPAALRAHRNFVRENPAPPAGYLQATLDGMLALARGDFNAAQEATERTVNLSEAWGGWVARETVMAHIGWRLYEIGQIDGLTRILERIPEQDVNPLNEAVWALATSLIYAEQGAIKLGVRKFCEICERTHDFRDLRHGPIRIGTLVLAAMVLAHPRLIAAFPAERARHLGHTLAELLLAQPDTLVIVGWPAILLGSKRHYIGLAELVAGDAESATDHLMSAVEEDYAFAALQLRAQYDLTRALRLQDAAPDEIDAELRRIQQEATAFGMANLAAQATADLAR
jgi:AAA ATPase domain